MLVSNMNCVHAHMALDAGVRCIEGGKSWSAGSICELTIKEVLRATTQLRWDALILSKAHSQLS